MTCIGQDANDQTGVLDVAQAGHFQEIYPDYAGHAPRDAATFLRVTQSGPSQSSAPQAQFSSGIVEDLNNKAKLTTMRKSYGFRTLQSPLHDILDRLADLVPGAAKR
jgi:hypothetical protein